MRSTFLDIVPGIGLPIKQKASRDLRKSVGAIFGRPLLAPDQRFKKLT
jgi:hypothetical protein